MAAEVGEQGCQSGIVMLGEEAPRGLAQILLEARPPGFAALIVERG